MSTLGERLRFLREKKLSLPRDKFVEGLGITAKTLERYEADEFPPNTDFLNRLWSKFSKVLTLADIDWLLFEGKKEIAAVLREEEGEPYNSKRQKVLPMLSDEEQEYVKKLIEVLRNPSTKKAIQENINTFLKVPKPDLVNKKNNEQQ